MGNYIISNLTDIYSVHQNHFQRWEDEYNRKTHEFEIEEELENIEFDKYISNNRDSLFMQCYHDELDEYYDYIEKTLLELRTQKK